MYKIIYNNQIIDVMKKIRYVKCLPRSQRTLSVDKNQANGILSSDSSVIYHIKGTLNTFKMPKKSIDIVPIEEEEYLELSKRRYEKVRGL